MRSRWLWRTLAVIVAGSGVLYLAAYVRGGPGVTLPLGVVAFGFAAMIVIGGPR